MNNIIAVFNNRNQAMQFANYLKRMGINCKTLSTPRELSVSCGLSVMLSVSALQQAKYILSNFKFSSFVRMYRIESNGYSKKYWPI